VQIETRDAQGHPLIENRHVSLEDIHDHFGADYVVTDRDHRPLADKLVAAKDFAELIYPSTSYAKSRDAAYLVFRVRGEHGTPP